jgi:hypothetical protein
MIACGCHGPSGGASRRPAGTFGRPTLEDVFVHLTGRQLEAGGGEARRPS